MGNWRLCTAHLWVRFPPDPPDPLKNIRKVAKKYFTNLNFHERKTSK